MSVSEKNPLAQNDHPGIRVLMITDHFYPDLSSGGRLLTDLAQGLCDDNWVGVITTFSAYNSARSNSSFEVFNGVEIHRVWSTSFSRQRIWGRLVNEIIFCFAASWKALFMPRVDVFFVLSSPPFLPLFISWVSMFKKIPYLFVMMDVFPDIAIRMGMLKPASGVVRFWESLSRLALRHADRVVVLGRCMKAVIEEKIGEAKRPVDIIHNWSDQRLIHPISRESNHFFNRHPDLRDKFIVMYSGNLGRFQDFETILSAATELQKNEAIRFVISGEGIRKSWIIQEIQTRSLRNVQFLPFVSQDQLIYSLNAADFGLVTLEAGAEGLGVPSKFYPLIAAGKPILALMGEHAEVARLVNEFDIGAVVSQGDVLGLVNSINFFYNNPDQYKQASERALKLFLEHFDRSNAVAAYQSSLRKTVFGDVDE